MQDRMALTPPSVAKETLHSYLSMRRWVNLSVLTTTSLEAEPSSSTSSFSTLSRTVWAESLLVAFFSCVPSTSRVRKRTAASCWAWSEPDPPFFRTSTTSPSFSSTVFLPCTRGLLNTFILSSRSSGYLLTSSVGRSLSVSELQQPESTGSSFLAFLETEPIAEDEEVEADEKPCPPPPPPPSPDELSASSSSSSRLAPPLFR